MIRKGKKECIFIDSTKRENWIKCMCVFLRRLSLPLVGCYKRDNKAKKEKRKRNAISLTSNVHVVLSCWRETGRKGQECLVETGSEILRNLSLPAFCEIKCNSKRDCCEWQAVKVTKQWEHRATACRRIFQSSVKIFRAKLPLEILTC